MKRRDVLKGAAVAAGVVATGISATAGASPTPCCERDHDGDGNCDRHPVLGQVHARFSLVLPGPYDKLDAQLQEGIEGFMAQWPDMVVEQRVTVELFDKDGKPWLIAPSWEGDELLLHIEPKAIFKERRWSMAKRAVDVRRHAYWRQEVKPTQEPVPPETSLSSLTTEQRALLKRNWDAWHKEQRLRLGSVGIQFMALVTPHPRDIEAVNTPFTTKDLVGFKRIKS